MFLSVVTTARPMYQYDDIVLDVVTLREYSIAIPFSF